MKLTGKTWAILLVVAGALVAAYCLLPPPPPPSDPMPHPNGIDDLIAAGKMLRGDDPFGPETREAFAGYVASNHAALDRARLGLTRQCRQPNEYSRAYNSQHGYDLIAEKQIAGAIEAEARLAELENHPEEAATSYLTVIKLGVKLERGGTLMDLFLDNICESRGITRLMKLVTKLTAGQSRALAREVEDLEAGREPLEKIIEHENASVRSYEMRSLGGMKDLVFGMRLRLKFQQLVASKYQKQSQQTLEFETSLAAHAFELEIGRAPKNWNDLVPAYLQRIPLDPGTTNQLTFSLR